METTSHVELRKWIKKIQNLKPNDAVLIDEKQFILVSNIKDNEGEHQVTLKPVL